MNRSLVISLLLVANVICFSNSGYSQDTLKILSWNVFLRPGILADKQMKRVDSIAHYLIVTDADVIILQEVFHKRATKRLNRLMRKSYPNITKSGPKSFYGVPSGVIIYSKLKFEGETTYYSYKDKTSADKLAKKGLVHVTLNVNGKRLDVMGTHLQAGQGEKRITIRKKQIEVINSVQRAIGDSNAVLYVGDFNISASTPNYDSLKKTLQAYTFEPIGKLKSTCNFDDHELMEPDGKPYWIDFIFIRKNKHSKLIGAVIESPRQMIEGKQLRLSDHNPIISTLVLK
ncbi:MAG: endonuclease/exonuclease/phosphatase family protein [Crocinitomicaceae bacterium]|nr:endonuclease/exonuclease/phosphatase family protein [Crocinitomicaceae bacterium]